jgi:16S rRNA G966 N2-methylase RsmD
VKALAGSHGAAARVAAVERAPAALKVLCGNLEKLGLTAGLLADGAVVIAEHRRKDVLEDSYGALERTRILKQGDAALSFYAARPMR